MTTETQPRHYAELYPYFMPCFEIGKPLHPNQLKGLVHYLRSIDSATYYSIGFDSEKAIVGIGEAVESGRGLAVYLGRQKTPKEPKIVINTGKFSYEDMAKMLTFADNALSWKDSIVMKPNEDQNIELERSCDHDKKCSLGKKPIVKRVLDRITA
jgi:hypothetical protein